MSELQHLNEFVAQNANADRTIKCTPDGIGLARFAVICQFPGAVEEVRQSLQLPVSVLRGVSSNEDNLIETAIKNILSVLVDKANRFVTLEQYAWLTRTIVAAEITNGFRFNESNLVKRLCPALEVIELASYNYCPLVIHLVTKSLIEDIPLEGVNLLHAIQKLGITNSPLLYYVAVSLIFAGLDVITSSSTSEYRLHTVDEFLNYLRVLNMEHLHRQRHNLQNIYQLLKLVSFYQNLVLVRHIGKPQAELDEEHKCYADFFRVSEQQRQGFQHWLEKSNALVHLVGNDRDIDYLILADLIAVDMLPLLDDVNQSDELF